jgi:hypothetical protein
MSIEKAGANLLGSVLGNPKKAFLVIHKSDDVFYSTKGDASVEVLAASVLASSDETAASAPAGAGRNASAGAGRNVETHVMQVQYNPSSIDFMANAEPIPVNRLQQNVVSNIPSQFNLPPSVTMTVELVFDAVNAQDSFMADKANIAGGLGGAVTAASAVTKRLKGAEYTVQPQTNALLAAVMGRNTNDVSFHWSGMTFSGIVTQAQARYTMFSVSGRPVRSVVKLVIEQELTGVGKAYWESAFDKCFGEENDRGTFGGQSLGQNVGNLLNLGTR